MTYWNFDGFDRRTEIWILQERDEKGAIRLRKAYENLACKTCGRIDELKALRRGVNPAAKPPKRPTDMLLSCDGYSVVSVKMRAALESIKELKAKFFPLPGAPDYFVLYPSTLFYPPENVRLCTRPMEKPREGEVFLLRSPRCKTCKRPGCVSWTFERFVVPRKIKLAGVVIEGGRLAHVSLICDDEVKDVLTAKGLTGWRAYHRLADSEPTPKAPSKTTGRVTTVLKKKAKAAKRK